MRVEKYKKHIRLAAIVCLLALFAVYFSNRGCSPSVPYLCWTPDKTYAPGQATEQRTDFYYKHRARKWHNTCDAQCRKESECYYYCCGGDDRFDQSEALENEGEGGCRCYAADKYYFDSDGPGTCTGPGNLRKLQAKGGAGDIEAQLTLGSFYETGRNDDPRPDAKEAFYWYNRAAEQGSARGQFKTGLFYEQGRGVAADCTRAMQWYEKSTAAAEAYKVLAEAYNADAFSGMEAAKRLAIIYEQGSCGPVDYVKAVKWYRLTGKMENAISPMPDDAAALHLADLYMKGGHGLEKNTAEGIKWYRAVATSSSPPENARAEFELAMIYAKGDLVEQDFQKACHWYAIAGRNPKYRSRNICDPIEPYLMPGELEQVTPKIGSGQMPE